MNKLLVWVYPENNRLVAYPANKAAEALAKIEASPRCTSRALRLAKEMGFEVVAVADTEGLLDKYLEVI